MTTLKREHIMIRRLAMIGRVAAIAIAIVFIAFSASAQTLEASLQQIASGLVNKMAQANLHSGTVLDFTDLQGTPNELGRYLSQELSDRLVASSKTVSFVDRSNIQYLLRERKLTLEGFVNPETARTLGNVTGVDTIVIGTMTMIGDKIRLSVRAVAVETGKIIDAESGNLPTANGIGELYTRGVARNEFDGATTGRGGRAESLATRPDPRTRFRGDSIKVIAKEVVVGLNGASATFAIENLSGIGFDAAISADGASIGPCVSQQFTTSGLNIADNKGQKPGYNIKEETMLKYFPANAKIDVTLSIFSCPQNNFSTVDSTDVAMSIVVSIGKDIFGIPISASNVHVRGTGY